MTGHRGFTLVELLVVVGIIALLVALLLPAIGIVQRRARATETMQVVSRTHDAVEVYRQLTGSLPSPQTGPVGHVDRVSGVGEQNPTTSSTDPTQGRLFDHLRNGGGLTTLSEYLGPRDSFGLVSLVDGWRNPIFYQIADGRTGMAPERAERHAFWRTRTRILTDRAYPVVYSVGPEGPTDAPGGAAEGRGWWQPGVEPLAVAP
ncbi:MAG: hypothetical protein RLZZ127_1059 [Planctomycetota bacterium]|jgi:prepilin-type N-terminal cleavage/methylation domain-containing protein